MRHAITPATRDCLSGNPTQMRPDVKVIRNKTKFK